FSTDMDSYMAKASSQLGVLCQHCSTTDLPCPKAHQHWLDISSRKLHRPAVCELCLYKYRRRRVLKYREIKLPDCSDRDVRYYTLFVCALAMMILSALATISGISFCGYISLCWSSNLEWTIEEYKQSRDSQYLSKLEELRRKINDRLSDLVLMKHLQMFESQLGLLKHLRLPRGTDSQKG
ncbi:hypothetical protein TELCIR_16518, partial [Teladorsagia circumcincta]